METILLVFSITCIVLGLLLLLVDTNSDLKVSDLKIPKKKFVELVLLWCTSNLGKNSFPFNLQIYYYRHQNWGGRYLHWNRLIIVYVYQDLMLVDLVGTVIHEYSHFRQFSNKNAESDYNKNYNEQGYWNNIYERQARKVAARHKESCYEWVVGEIAKSSKSR